jgi:phospholipid/cholesterol/gamma-HCH transport system substrate-binding protein
MTIARGAAIASLVVAVIAVAVLMFGSGGGETYVLHMQSANQLVTGNSVKVGGLDVGKITDISLSKDNQADVKVEITDGDFTPLHEGTTAVVRVTSLPSVANRYIALTPGPNNAPEVPGGGVISEDKTTNAVDLDQLFNTLDPPTRKGLQGVLQGFATWYAGQSSDLAQTFKYLGPSLESFSQVMAELVRDQKAFNDFVVNGSRAVTAIAERRNDLADLVTNGNGFARALGTQNTDLNKALALFPATLRQGSTTFTTLRSALKDLNRLTNVSKPATKNLAPFLSKFADLFKEFQPAFKDFRYIVRNPGPHNDATDQMKQIPSLEKLAGTNTKNSVAALKQGQPVIESIRPYAADLAAWITHFAEVPSYYDANGHYARVLPIFNAFSYDQSNNQLNPLAPSQRKNILGGRGNRFCPGAATQPAADGSNPWLADGALTPADCDPNTRVPGP